MGWSGLRGVAMAMAEGPSDARALLIISHMAPWTHHRAKRELLTHQLLKLKEIECVAFHIGTGGIQWMKAQA